MADIKLQIYGDISKFEPCDDGSVIIEGIASSEVRDVDGEIITADAMRKALPSYMQAPAVREMHDNIAAGKVLSAFVDDEGNTHVRAKIVDKGTVQKIKDKVLRGFSIFGNALKKEGKKITELVLKTIDVVDLPNNPKAWFSIVKFDKPGDKCSDPECKHHVEGHTSKCAMCKKKMEKSEKSEELDNPHDKSMKKMLCAVAGLPETTSDEDLQQALTKRLAAPAPTNADALISKVDSAMAAISKLEKSATEANERVELEKRNNILQKMQREGRYVQKSSGEAYKLDELQKMDIGTLEILAVNSPQLPLKAAHIFKGDNAKPRIPNGADGKALKGDVLIETVWENAGYGTLEEMTRRFNPQN